MPNDRLLLGLKGTMSEFELTLMRRRLVEGVQAKAQRGEYRIPIPVGYLWTRETGLETDPDRRVQEAIRTVFRLYDRFESGRQVLLHVVRDGIRFPRPAEGRRHGPPWQCVAPVYRSIIAVLQNPFYAGAYAHGKSTHRTTLVGGRLAKTYGHHRPMAAWRVLLRDHHAGYITWTELERNHERFRRHAFGKPAGRAKAGRGGRALLAGLLRCRRCGRMLQVAYTSRGTVARYACRVAQHSRDLLEWHTEVLGQHHHERHGAGTQMHACCAQRVGGLQRMPALHTPATRATAPDLHIESANDRSDQGQIFLVLRRDAHEVNRAITGRARRRERGVVGFIDPRGNGSSSSASIPDAGASTRSPTTPLRAILRERGGVTEASPPRRVELLREAFALTLPPIAFARRPRQLLTQSRDFLLLSLDQIVAFVTRRSRALICHTAFMADSRPKYKYGILDLAPSRAGTR